MIKERVHWCVIVHALQRFINKLPEHENAVVEREIWQM
jgi:hypothetical protein